MPDWVHITSTSHGYVDCNANHIQSFIPLFDDNGTLSVERPAKFNTLIKFKSEFSDEEVCKAISECKEAPMKKNRVVLGQATMDITLLSEDYLTTHSLTVCNSFLSSHK